MSLFTFSFRLDDFKTLDAMACELVKDSRVGDHDHWFLRFRQALHGMVARVTTVCQNYNLLHEWENRYRDMFFEQIENECHTSVILFAMDSSLECYVFALNALGFAVSRRDFLDLTDAAAVKGIGPKNILGGGQKDKKNPVAGYSAFYPKAVAHWDNHRRLIGLIMDHHDVNKHRLQSVGGGEYRDDPPTGFFEAIEAETGRPINGFERSRYSPPKLICLTENPKLPSSISSSTSYNLESLATEYVTFISELMALTCEDVRRNIISRFIRANGT